MKKYNIVRIDEGKEAACPDGTTPDDMKEGVGEKKTDDKNVIIDKVKETACPDGTPPDDMEKGVGEKKMTRMSELTRKKMQHVQMALLLVIWRKV